MKAWLSKAQPGQVGEQRPAGVAERQKKDERHNKAKAYFRGVFFVKSG